ncbi:hypothetical protein BC828DRAFT_386376 [Blastocladiella britannica]|nr:hypothetical protein BC828DRAFT_386376 [Blastocladiella britannica]
MYRVPGSTTRRPATGTMGTTAVMADENADCASPSISAANRAAAVKAQAILGQQQPASPSPMHRSVFRRPPGPTANPAPSPAAAIRFPPAAAATPSRPTLLRPTGSVRPTPVTFTPATATRHGFPTTSANTATKPTPSRVGGGGIGGLDVRRRQFGQAPPPPPVLQAATPQAKSIDTAATGTGYRGVQVPLDPGAEIDTCPTADPGYIDFHAIPPTFFDPPEFPAPPVYSYVPFSPMSRDPDAVSSSSSSSSYSSADEGEKEHKDHGRPVLAHPLAFTSLPRALRRAARSQRRQQQQQSPRRRQSGSTVSTSVLATPPAAIAHDFDFDRTASSLDEDHDLSGVHLGLRDSGVDVVGGGLLMFFED